MLNTERVCKSIRGRTSQDWMPFRLQRGSGASGKKTYGHHDKSPPNTQQHCKGFDSGCCWPSDRGLNQSIDGKRGRGDKSEET
jgi:hypothetical protein